MVARGCILATTWRIKPRLQKSNYNPPKVPTPAGGSKLHLMVWYGMVNVDLYCAIITKSLMR